MRHPRIVSGPLECWLVGYASASTLFPGSDACPHITDSGSSAEDCSTTQRTKFSNFVEPGMDCKWAQAVMSLQDLRQAWLGHFFLPVLFIKEGYILRKSYIYRHCQMLTDMKHKRQNGFVLHELGEKCFCNDITTIPWNGQLQINWLKTGHASPSQNNWFCRKNTKHLCIPVHLRCHLTFTCWRFWDGRKGWVLLFIKLGLI